LRRFAQCEAVVSGCLFDPWGIGAQPASETIEVAFYAGFAALALWARPAIVS
jgi:hypothetical protein